MNWYKIQKEASIKEILKGMGLIIIPTAFGLLLGNMAENLYAKYKENPQELKREIIEKAEDNNLIVKNENDKIIIEEPKSNNIEKLLDAIRRKESNNGQILKGDLKDGIYRALGPYQIWESYWKDASDFGNKKLDYKKNVFNDEISRDIIKLYWQRYAPKALANGDLETLAKIHNGGPNGPSNSNTEKYWQDIKNLLNN